MHAPHDIVEEIAVAELDCIFISYDEPNAELNWARNLQRVPWAKRVHGVKGFDAAHKAAAELSRTARFITIDGDTLIDENFMDQTLKVRAGIRDALFAWKSLNTLHGLCYGNGSLKCWPRELVRNMRTHEVSEGEQAKVDFCWTIPHVGMRACYSATNSSASPYQAFRSGFREGCKITLERGSPLEPGKIQNRSWNEAMRLLKIWCCVGADSDNGLWSIYGARSGLRMMMNYPSPEYEQIADYDWFLGQFDQAARAVGGIVDPLRIHDEFRFNRDRLMERIIDLARPIREQSGIELCLFDPVQSEMLRSFMPGPVRDIDPMEEG
jgi:hypothetical protein